MLFFVISFILILVPIEFTSGNSNVTQGTNHNASHDPEEKWWEEHFGNFHTVLFIVYVYIRYFAVSMCPFVWSPFRNPSVGFLCRMA